MEVLALLAALGLVALNGFFVAAEFAIVKIRATRVEEMVRTNRMGAVSVKKVTDNLDSYLSATQLGITLASLALGWIGEPAFARLIEVPLRALGVSNPDVIHAAALACAFMTITFLHIVAGELAPKSLAIMRPEAVATAVAVPMRAFHFICFPAIWALNSVAMLLLRGVGLASPGHDTEHHSEDELRIILAQARRTGGLSAPRGEVMKKALALSQKTAHHVMIPRNEVVYLDVNRSLEENLERARLSDHRRFPLCAQELDDVIGVVDIRNVVFGLLEGPVDLRDFATPVAYFPELMPAERLLAAFRARYVPMAVIVDEYGGASGIVTPVDVMEAVAGDMPEEAESDLVVQPGGTYEIDGHVTLEELEERLHIALNAEGMSTVAGFLMRQLGRMPKRGDRVRASGYLLDVLEVDGPRIRRVLIQGDSRDAPDKRDEAQA